MAEINERTKRTSTKRAYDDDLVCDRPAKRTSLEENPKTCSDQLYIPHEQQAVCDMSQSFMSSSSSSSASASSSSSSSFIFSSSSSFSTSSSSSSPHLMQAFSSSLTANTVSIHQLVQVADSNHAPDILIARSTSSDSISDVDSDGIDRLNKKPTVSPTTATSSTTHSHVKEQEQPPQSLLDIHHTTTQACNHNANSHIKLPGFQQLIVPLALESPPLSLPSSDYMDRQPDLNHQMRAILFDWLVEVAEEYKLKPSTLYLTVSIIDRFLSECELPRDKLQLVGVSSMLIACKIEEDDPPRVKDFVFICDNAFTKNEISKMEKKIFSVLAAKIQTSTTHTFLELYQRAGHVDEEVCQLANYLGELTLMDYSFLRYNPRIIAASLISVALHSTECAPWSDALQSVSRYTLADLRDCMADVHSLFMDAPLSQLQAVREKYSAPNPYLCVSNIAPPDTLPMTEASS